MSSHLQELHSTGPNTGLFEINTELVTDFVGSAFYLPDFIHICSEQKRCKFSSETCILVWL